MMTGTDDGFVFACCVESVTHEISSIFAVRRPFALAVRKVVPRMRYLRAAVESCNVYRNDDGAWR